MLRLTVTDQISQLSPAVTCARIYRLRPVPPVMEGLSRQHWTGPLSNEVTDTDVMCRNVDVTCRTWDVTEVGITYVLCDGSGRIRIVKISRSNRGRRNKTKASGLLGTDWINLIPIVWILHRNVSLLIPKCGHRPAWFFRKIFVAIHMNRNDI